MSLLGVRAFTWCSEAASWGGGALPAGSTGKPKGILHTTGGYLTYVTYTHKLVFDYRPGDVYACMADCGWITGHSYILCVRQGLAYTRHRSVPMSLFHLRWVALYDLAGMVL